MAWIQVLIIIGSMGGLFLWSRSESRADSRATNEKMDHSMAKMDTKIDKFMAASAQETKDFHGRLCSLEARWHGKPLDDE